MLSGMQTPLHGRPHRPQLRARLSGTQPSLARRAHGTLTGNRRVPYRERSALSLAAATVSMDSEHVPGFHLALPTGILLIRAHTIAKRA